ncbi:dephospho-CoA kinase [Cyclobacterium jeungdonense]|uniref:Dephospho-CoA kinase n=1 Tax=Cyclobacterium jeungdonense TaxID=708087 RepID=A0ABT8C4Z6_9BACT|nr:dephospho-CoA kinase [Cyclobacterium jeungdonense]MDN3687863.1 dephospho-CoA kinase [Cyclobacterium jeungdonense]
MNRQQPVLLGITGGIGAGKSLISKLFALLNVPVYNADGRAKWLMEHEGSLREKIIVEFGKDAYLTDGQPNRSYLAKKVFSNSVETEKINRIVHPAVKRDFKTWVEFQQSPYVLKEAALLFETGSYLELDYTIHVTAPVELRVSRILKRDPHRSPEQIRAIMDKQWSDDKKNELATFVLPNDEKELLIPKVLAIHHKLINP